MTDEDVEMHAQELLNRYPYDPKVNPVVYPSGSPERLRGCPPGMREPLARIFVRCDERWRIEEQYAARRYVGAPEVL